MVENDDKARLQRRHYSKARLKTEVEKVANAIARDLAPVQGKTPSTSMDVVAALRNITNAVDKKKLDGELENMSIGWLFVHERETALVELAHDKGVLDDMAHEVTPVAMTARKSKTSKRKKVR
jgi:hypothetical protein